MVCVCACVRVVRVLCACANTPTREQAAVQALTVYHPTFADASDPTHKTPVQVGS